MFLNLSKSEFLSNKLNVTISSSGPGLHFAIVQVLSHRALLARLCRSSCTNWQDAIIFSQCLRQLTFLYCVLLGMLYTPCFRVLPSLSFEINYCADIFSSCLSYFYFNLIIRCEIHFAGSHLSHPLLLLLKHSWSAQSAQLMQQAVRLLQVIFLSSGVQTAANHVLNLLPYHTIIFLALLVTRCFFLIYIYKWSSFFFFFIRIST